MLSELPLDVLRAVIQHIEMFGDMCNIALVSTDMATFVSRKKHAMVIEPQLRLQCVGCRNNFRVPGARLFRIQYPMKSNDAWPWICPICPAKNELSQMYSVVVTRAGWRQPGHWDIDQGGQERDMTLIPPSPKPLCKFSKTYKRRRLGRLSLD